jgi:ParB-like chromosome segregation protein Spo0J
MSDRLHGVRVEFLPISALKLHTHNPRTHSPRQIRQIADSVRQFGFTNPIWSMEKAEY